MKSLSFPLSIFNSIDDYAFSGDVEIESISLEKATYYSISPKAFDGLRFQNTSCVDLPNFAVTWADEVFECSSEDPNMTCYSYTVTCETLNQVKDPASLLIMALKENKHGLPANLN